MEDFLKGVSESNKQIIKSFTPLVVVILLFLLVGKFSIGQVANLKSEINKVKKTESVLNKKLSTLLAVSQTTTLGANAALSALPKSIPSLQVVSQLKTLASVNQVVLNNIKASIVGSTDPSDLSYLNTAFDLSGSEEQILQFIKSIDTIAPITLIDKMSLAENGGLYTANISARTYYAPLPTKIPTITQSVDDLTSTEKVLLTQISNLSQSEVVEPVYASGSAVNVNPFGI
jgi:hypothetical protein